MRIIDKLHPNGVHPDECRLLFMPAKRLSIDVVFNIDEGSIFFTDIYLYVQL
jgi:hypothetical protein